jgi:hypothetical protein
MNPPFFCSSGIPSLPTLTALDLLAAIRTAEANGCHHFAAALRRLLADQLATRRAAA